MQSNCLSDRMALARHLGSISAHHGSMPPPPFIDVPSSDISIPVVFPVMGVRGNLRYLPWVVPGLADDDPLLGARIRVPVTMLKASSVEQRQTVARRVAWMYVASAALCMSQQASVIRTGDTYTPDHEQAYSGAIGAIREAVSAVSMLLNSHGVTDPCPVLTAFRLEWLEAVRLMINSGIAHGKASGHITAYLHQAGFDAHDWNHSLIQCCEFIPFDVPLNSHYVSKPCNGSSVIHIPPKHSDWQGYAGSLRAAAFNNTFEEVEYAE